MTRSDARRHAFKALFAYEANKTTDINELWQMVSESTETTPSDFAEELFFGTVEHISELDAEIAANSKTRIFERISKVALAILRLSLYEIKYMPDIGLKISINEALDLAHEFGDDKTASFINGVIAGIVNTRGTSDAE